ncbi:MAG: 5-oxoprolinase subunit PxpA [Chloroflexota bacterium]|nr:5-oxoprolinase subunit PxpA [Chloroflexota bacterium]
MAGPVKIDLNCDLGESFGRHTLGDDAEIMKLISSANIACGFHAGEPSVMARTVSLAKQNSVAVGAHPGYPDLHGFGRRKMDLSLQEVADTITYQLGALDAFARVSGVKLVHVKPHGALYNLASEDDVLANAIAHAVAAYNPDLIMVGLAGSALIKAGQEVGLRVAREGFPDRAYLPDGNLMPRSQPGAVLHEPDAVASNAIRLVREGLKIEDKVIRMDTLCLHGDNTEALRNAQAVRRVLEAEGVEIRSLASL